MAPSSNSCRPARFRRQQIQIMTRRLPMCLALILVAGSCTNPRVQANIAQALNDVGNELTAQRQDMSTLQEEIDSLKQAMAHQDTIIKRLINVTGIPPSGPSSFQPSGPFGQR